ncbi:MAG: zinc ribbon-containing protein [Thiohalomonadaceae bacterium]
MSEQDNKHRLADAYERMLERVQGFVQDVEHETGPALKHALERARDTAAELGELTRDEAERVAYYLRRDLEDAGKFLKDSGEELGGWLRFDVELIERTLAGLFLQAADRTKVELERLHLEAEAVGEWHSGEVTGPGTLVCKSCGNELVMRRAAHIPPCPRCGGTDFRRTLG